MKVVLVACVKSKLSHAAPVAELYTSPLFKGSLRFARLLNADRIFVLSAKHGLLSLDDVIEPYEDTLKGKSRSQQREWAKRVRLQLSQTTNLESDHFVFLAGADYRRDLSRFLRSVEVPLAGMRFGSQRKFYATLKC